MNNSETIKSSVTTRVQLELFAGVKYLCLRHLVMG